MSVCVRKDSSHAELTPEQSKKLAGAKDVLNILFANGFTLQDPDYRYAKNACYERGKEFENIVYPIIEQHVAAKPQ